MAGRALFANWTKARLRRSSSVSPSAGCASRQIEKGDFASSSPDATVLRPRTKTRLNKTGLNARMVLDLPRRFECPLYLKPRRRARHRNSGVASAIFVGRYAMDYTWQN